MLNPIVTADSTVTIAFLRISVNVPSNVYTLPHGSFNSDLGLQAASYSNTSGMDISKYVGQLTFIHYVVQQLSNLI